MKFMNFKYKYYLATIILLFVLSLYFRSIKWSNIDGMTTSSPPTTQQNPIPTPTPTPTTPQIKQNPIPTQSTTTVPSTVSGSSSTLPIPGSSSIHSSSITPSPPDLNIPPEFWPYINLAKNVVQEIIPSSSSSSSSSSSTSVYRQLNQF